MFDTVAIVGMGLLGGSLGLDLKQGELARRVIGIARRAETCALAVERGACDEAWPALEGIRDADLVVLATPVRTIIETMPQIALHAASNAVVTDLGSTKSEIVAAGEGCLGERFVGGHPMAGSHEGGIEAARLGLFRAATWVFTPTDNTSLDALERLRGLAAALGARPTDIPLGDHDRIAAAVSHMPHLAAAAISRAVGELADGDERFGALVGGGLRDMTRLAASPAVLWRDIFSTNRAHTRDALIVCREALDQALAALEDDGEVQRYFEGAAAAREKLIPNPRPD
ncbi:MAG TPA: prephenate dehydrogenase/arogenate dehydrogenase family protein [Armatimonadota bacterium]